MKNDALLIFCLQLSAVVFSQTGTSTLVSLDANGKLLYNADSKGNTVPDFSYVGYKNSDQDIPTVPVVLTISAVFGDNTQNIQNAINQVAAMTPDVNGFRGAILFKKGNYAIDSTIVITKGGIVLRGEGATSAGTVFYATRKQQYEVVQFLGSGGPKSVSSSSKLITDVYVPVGARTFAVESGHSFAVGNEVFLQRKPNQAWIHLLGMDTLKNIDPQDTTIKNWTTAEYLMRYCRKVVAVNGNNITIDAPVVDCIDTQYAEGRLMKYTWTGKIENVGIENIYFDSYYNGTSDELHGWTAVSFENLRNAWASNIEVHHFGYSAVRLKGNAMFVTVQDCKNIDPISKTEGGRKYSFNVDGQRNLIKNCSTNGGRHDFVTGSQTCGPNVFLYGNCINQKADIGPHHRWGTGQLYDNIISDGEQNVQNRLDYGSGHGWAGAQIMFWNCEAKKIVVQSPANAVNWAIGCKGNVTSVGSKYSGSAGFFESIGNPITITSLFEQQLCERKSLCDLNTGTDEFSTNIYTLYPNPSSSQFMLVLPNAETSTLKVLDVNGKMIENIQATHQNQILFGENLMAGIYFVEISDGNKSDFIKLIKL
jgi:hypothetical protein